MKCWNSHWYQFTFDILWMVKVKKKKFLFTFRIIRYNAQAELSNHQNLIRSVPNYQPRDVAPIHNMVAMFVLTSEAKHKFFVG